MTLKLFLLALFSSLMVTANGWAQESVQMKKTGAFTIEAQAAKNP
jgi:hypothetical protein